MLLVLIILTYSSGLATTLWAFSFIVFGSTIHALKF